MARSGGVSPFAALPDAVKDCLSAAGPEFRAAAKKDPAGFAKNITQLLASSAAALGCRPEEALFLTGFDRANRTPGRLEAALAELRAAVFLEAEGFGEIRPVRRWAGKTADLRAERGAAGYVFEVRWVRGGFGAEPVKRLSSKCRKKAVQVGASAKKCGVARGGIIFVAGPLRQAAFRPSAALAATAEALLPNAGGALRHICLLSGEESAVRPPWAD